MRLRLFLTIFLGFSIPAQAQNSFGQLKKEPVLARDSGFFTCNGGSSAPLFKQDCNEISVDRVSFGGNILYEGWCLDSNGKKYVFSCAHFTFEPEKITTNTKKGYFDK